MNQKFFIALLVIFLPLFGGCSNSPESPDNFDNYATTETTETIETIETTAPAETTQNPTTTEPIEPPEPPEPTTTAQTATIPFPAEVDVAESIQKFINATNAQKTATQPAQQAHLFGERHSDEIGLQMQLAFWENFYNNFDMRHLFVELPFFVAEFLNIWLHEPDDTILDNIFDNIRGTAMDSVYTRNFLRDIKENFPETIFHGTDIGHAYQTLGVQFLQHLTENGLQDTELYTLTQENIEQGRMFYEELDGDFDFRVTQMTKNFSRAFAEVSPSSVMTAFYGGWHTIVGHYPNSGIPTLATRLLEIYGDAIITNNLLDILLMPTATIEIGGVAYTATFTGETGLTNMGLPFVHIMFYRLEDAYNDFRDNPTTDDVLPLSNFHVDVEQGQIFAIILELQDGTMEVSLYRYSGHIWNNQPSTQQIYIE
ncbi:MAG: hypothetical protein FWG68_04995 [Defluviitaleaceae bacterium]|nr:hypothetical protein [Defluviitaleaceae bacterium]